MVGKWKEIAIIHQWLTLIVPKYSASLFMQGGGSYMTPPLSPVIAVIKGQTKKQMIKFCKKTNFEQFFNGCYRYLTVKPPKTVIHTNASGRCIFHSINLKLYEKAKTSIFHDYRHWALNGGKCGVKNGVILTGKIKLYKYMK